ncbi:MAG: helix-turn-helix domain-containing protein [Deltaproteobacteria bacterium]|nr:helix-turn-helix domain-containing protein [Deltaproteobacteria bacterium]
MAGCRRSVYNQILACQKKR